MPFFPALQSGLNFLVLAVGWHIDFRRVICQQQCANQMPKPLSSNQCTCCSRWLHDGQLETLQLHRNLKLQQQYSQLSTMEKSNSSVKCPQCKHAFTSRRYFLAHLRYPKTRGVSRSTMVKQSRKLPKSANMMGCLKEILHYRKHPSIWHQER